MRNFNSFLGHVSISDLKGSTEVTNNFFNPLANHYLKKPWGKCSVIIAQASAPSTSLGLPRATMPSPPLPPRLPTLPQAPAQVLGGTPLTSTPPQALPPPLPLSPLPLPPPLPPTLHPAQMLGGALPTSTPQVQFLPVTRPPRLVRRNAIQH